MVCNDSHIVLVHMHYHSWVEYLLSCLKLFLRFLFVSELILTWIGWASAGRLQEYEVRTMVLMEDNDDNDGGRELTVLLVPYCLVQGVVFSCSCSA